MSKTHCLKCKSLHSLQTFISKTQRIQVENGQYVTLLFIIQVIIDIHGHNSEIFTLVSQIHENVDWVLSIKNIFELEGITNLGEPCFRFSNRSIPFFQRNRSYENQVNEGLLRWKHYS